MAIASLALIGDRPTLEKVVSWLDVETLCLLFGGFLDLSVIKLNIVLLLGMFLYHITSVTKLSGRTKQHRLLLTSIA